MKKRVVKVVSLLLVLAMVFSLVACGGNTEETEPAGSGGETQGAGSELADEQVFSFVIGSEPTILDPWVNNEGTSSNVIAAIHEPMLRKGENDEGWEPGLMTDYQANEDNTVHTLTLREGMKWQDGTDITVDDIVYSFQRAVSAELGSAIAYRYFPILNAEKVYLKEVDPSEMGVKAIDDKTIEITTEEPCDYFIDMMTADSFAPIQKAAAEAYGEQYGSDVDKIVASGPFKLTEWTHKNSMVLEKNENYWDAENVKLERIDVTITSDTNTQLGMFQNGELSLLKLNTDLVPTYESWKNYTTDDRLMVTFIEFNPRNEFLANKNIREALSIAYNRKIFAQQVMGDESLAAYGLVPYGVKGLDGGDFREQAGNIVKDASDASEIERAKELLQTGLDELGKTVEDLQKGFSVQCLEGGKTQAQAIQNMWKENLGVEMPVSVMDQGVLVPMLMEGTFDCVIGGGQNSNYRDPEGFMQFIYDENKWDNEEFRALIEKAHETTGNERVQAWMDAEKMVLDEFIYIPQVYAKNHWVAQDNVNGLRISTYGYELDFKNVYITK